MRLREYAPEDLKQILKLFYDTVHTVNAADYSRAQLDAWALTFQPGKNPLRQIIRLWLKMKAL